MMDVTLAAADHSCQLFSQLYNAGLASLISELTFGKILQLPYSSIHDGVLTITATVRKSGNARQVVSPVRVLPASPTPPPDKTLLSQLQELHRSGAGADVTLQCSDGELLPAHAWLLSLRSPVFAAQLSGPLAVKSRVLPVPDDIQSTIMRRVLHFIYADELTVASPEEGQHLLNAADHYALPGLLSIAERALCNSLTVDAAAFILTLAEQHGAVALKQTALSFVAAHGIAVMDTPGWEHLRASCPELVEAVMRTMACGGAMQA